MTKDEALTLALEALENGMKFVWADPEREAGFVAIDAIKEALAQPEQKPMAWEQFHEHLVERNFCPRCGKRTAGLAAIHTCTPPQIAAGSQAFYGFPTEPVSTPNAGGKCVTAGETAPIDPNQWAFDRGLESS